MHDPSTHSSNVLRARSRAGIQRSRRAILIAAAAIALTIVAAPATVLATVSAPTSEASATSVASATEGPASAPPINLATRPPTQARHSVGLLYVTFHNDVHWSNVGARVLADVPLRESASLSATGKHAGMGYGQQTGNGVTSMLATPNVQQLSSDGRAPTPSVHGDTTGGGGVLAVGDASLVDQVGAGMMSAPLSVLLALFWLSALFLSASRLRLWPMAEGRRDHGRGDPDVCRTGTRGVRHRRVTTTYAYDVTSRLGAWA